MKRHERSGGVATCRECRDWRGPRPTCRECRNGWWLRPAALLLGAVWLGSGAVAVAGTDRWAQIGPPGGEFALATAPSAQLTFYAVAIAGAVYRSLDGGASWELRGSIPNPGPPGFFQSLAGSANSLTVDPASATTVYACTDGGPFKTTDGGATWRQLGGMIPIFHIAVTPSAPQTLYGLGGNQVERSDDGGVTWRTLGGLPGADSLSAYDLVVDPTDANTAYALTTQGVAATSDGGAHWTARLATIFDVPSRIALDPRQPATLYVAAAQFFHPEVAPVWRSADAGMNWAPAGAGLPALVRDLAVAPSGTLYAAADDALGGSQVFRSTDGATSWQQVAALAEQVANLAADTGSTDRLYAAAFPHGTQGLLLGRDRGRTWSAPAQPPSGQLVYQVLSSSAGAGLYVATTPWVSVTQQFLHSADGGATWSALAATGQQPWLGVPRLLLDARPGILYAAGQGVGENNLISGNGGAGWLALPLPANSGSNLLDLAADPTRPGRLSFLSFNPCLATPPACTRLLLNRSESAGQTWSLVARLTVPGGLVPRSSLEPGAPSSPGPPVPAASLRLDPVHPDTTYVLAGGLYRSTAAQPALTALGLRASVVDLAIDPGAPATLYAAVARPRMLWKSTDGGITWTAASSNLPRQATPVALAIDPIRSSTLYLATDHGLFVTDDAAGSWRRFDDGLAGLPVLGLAVSANHPRTVWAATLGGGVFVLTRKAPL